MQTVRLAISLLMLSGMAVGGMSVLEAQERRGDATTQSQQQDGRYLIYMRGIT